MAETSTGSESSIQGKKCPSPASNSSERKPSAAASMCSCKTFLLAAAVAFVSVVVQRRMVTLPEPTGVLPDRTFRAYHDVLGDACDEECFSMLQDDVAVLGSDEVLWMDHSNKHVDDTMLESLARSIFEFHCGSVEGCGGEWWVQVRSTKDSALPDPMEKLPFHFDKDEWVDDHLDKYRGPYLTSVTYLNPGSMPTLALDIRQTEDFKLVPHRGEHGKLAGAFLGVPGLGSHIAFDGSLLHGAFMHKDFFEADDALTLPELRYVLVMSFWVNGYKPKGAGVLRKSKAARMHKSTVRAFGDGVRLENAVKVLDGSALDAFKLEADRTVDLKFRIAHGTSKEREILEVEICLPTPQAIAQSNYSSFNLRFGKTCTADVVSITGGGVSIVQFDLLREIKETLKAADEVWGEIPGFADFWALTKRIFSVSGGVGVAKEKIKDLIEWAVRE